MQENKKTQTKLLSYIQQSIELRKFFRLALSLIVPSAYRYPR